MIRYPHQDHFLVERLNPQTICTRTRVATIPWFDLALHDSQSDALARWASAFAVEVLVFMAT